MNSWSSVNADKLYVGAPPLLAMGGTEGRPRPGGAQIIPNGIEGGPIQVQPALTPVPSADPVSPEETAGADDWPSSAPCVWLPDGIALGPDGDPQAPIPSPPNTTNKVHARLTTVDMSDL